MPRSIRELYRQHGSLNNIDFSSVGNCDLSTHENFLTGEDMDAYSVHADEDNESGSVPSDLSSARIVSDLPFNYFREKLVDHFDILLQQKKLVWPKLNKRNTSL